MMNARGRVLALVTACSCVMLSGAGGVTGAVGSPTPGGESLNAGDPAPPPAPAAVLRVCADPNNLPFSNSRGEGFENRIASLVAGEMGREVSYTWWAQRRGFIRNTLRAGRCDVIIGILRGDEMVLTTRPYYRSTYVFVYRKDRHYDLTSLDDPRLRKLKIGVHVIGDDYNALPPGIALARRGIVKNVSGYSIYGDYSRPSPPSDLIRAVAEEKVDVALAWGPLAGYYATREGVPLEVVPVSPRMAMPGMPFDFEISMGVRRGDSALVRTLDRILVKRRDDIEKILRSYGTPMLGVARARVARRAPGDGDAPCDRGDGRAVCE